MVEMDHPQKSCLYNEEEKRDKQKCSVQTVSKIVLPLFSLSEMYPKKMQDIWTGLLFLVQFLLLQAGIFYILLQFGWLTGSVKIYLCMHMYVRERVCVCVSGKTFTLKLETALWIISEARHIHPENLKMHQASQKKGSGVCWHEQYKGKVFTGTVWGVDAYRNSLWKGNCLHEYLGRKRLQNK